jgi:streptogramin lyase
MSIGVRRLGILMVVLALAAGARAASLTVGTVTVYPLPAGSNGAVGIAPGVDGNEWFTEAFPSAQLETSIGVITPHGTVTQTIDTGKHSDAPAIAAGPDGALWFPEELSGSIGRVTTAGAVTHFAVPNSRSEPAAIAAGPDGNLWFTERLGGKIGRITPAGVVTEFPAAGSLAGGYASAIATGADGSLWFTEHYPATVGRLTLDGALSEFPMPHPSCDPIGIAAGPDGNLWIAERAGNAIARVTPSGTITEFRLPRAGSGPFEIAAGSDGNLWFDEAPPTTSVTAMLGRITPAGTITEFPSPSNGYPAGIAPGADGNLWLALPQGIGRVTVAAPSTGEILSLDPAFVPATRRVTLGRNAQWSFYGPSVREVADASGLGLFDSGPRSIVSFYSVPFTAAGLYPYRDPGHPTLTGKISVPLLATPASGTPATTFSLTWASAAPTGARVFDVQIEPPGATRYAAFLTGTTLTGTSFTPSAGTGTYRFRSRLRDAHTGAATGYSAGTAITVG